MASFMLTLNRNIYASAPSPSQVGKRMARRQRVLSQGAGVTFESANKRLLNNGPVKYALDHMGKGTETIQSR